MSEGVLAASASRPVAHGHTLPIGASDESAAGSPAVSWEVRDGSGSLTLAVRMAGLALAQVGTGPGDVEDEEEMQAASARGGRPASDHRGDLAAVCRL